MALHPIPWRADDFMPECVRITDADGKLVETVYGRDGDPSGMRTAERIVYAVNLRESAAPETGWMEHAEARASGARWFLSDQADSDG